MSRIIPTEWIEVWPIAIDEIVPGFRLVTRGQITQPEWTPATKMVFLFFVVGGIVVCFLPWEKRDVSLDIPVKYLMSAFCVFMVIALLVASQFMVYAKVRIDTDRQIVEFLESATGKTVDAKAVICIQVCWTTLEASQVRYYQVNLVWKDGTWKNGVERVVRRCLMADARRWRCVALAEQLSELLKVSWVDVELQGKTDIGAS